MSQNITVTETVEQSLAQTQQQDERDFEFWHDQINERGWTVHLGDEHGIGRSLPYAMAVIEVQHYQGDDSFHSARNDPRTTLGYPVIVFADELGNTNGTTRNRQSDGNTYIYQLSGLDAYDRDGEQGYAALPTSYYQLEIMIPLFKTEAIVMKRAHATGYRVSTAAGFVYDSDELEEGRGFMGLCQAVTSFAPRGFVWKLVLTPSSIHGFEIEMANRALTFWGANYHDPEPEAFPAIHRWLANVKTPEQDVREDTAVLKVEDIKVEDPSDETITRDTSDTPSEIDDYVVVKTEPESDDDKAAVKTKVSPVPEYKPVALWRDLSKKLKRFRNDVDELWVERGGKRMKF